MVTCVVPSEIIRHLYGFAMLYNIKVYIYIAHLKSVNTAKVNRQPLFLTQML